MLYEIEQNPLPIRQMHAYSVLAKARTTIELTTGVKERASQFLEYGLKPLDAIHLAMAEVNKVDYFCTCDDRLIRGAKRIGDLQVKVVSPLDLVQEIEK